MESEDKDKVHNDGSKEGVSKGKMSAFEKITRALKTFPKKRHIEYVSALLSIPVLLSVITLNYLNIENKKTTSPSPTPTQNTSIIIKESLTPAPSGSEPTSAPIVTQAECIRGIGPISIDFPEESQTVSDNPLCFVINYTDSAYCSVVWSYKINDGSWSNYSSNAPCIYNPPQGDNTFYLRVQSTVDQTQQKVLNRNFTYTSSGVPVLTPTTTINPTSTSD